MGEISLRDAASGVFGGPPDNDDIETIAPLDGSGEEIWGELCALPQETRADVLSRDELLWNIIYNCGNKNEKGALFQEILTDIGRMNPVQKTAILSAAGAVDALSLITFQEERKACVQKIRDLIETLDDGQQATVLSTEGVPDALLSAEKMLDKWPQAAVREAAPGPLAVA